MTSSSFHLASLSSNDLEIAGNQKTEDQLIVPCKSPNYFGDTLKEFRKARNLTQVELAQKTNLSQAQISAYESGRHKPDFEEMLKLSQALNIEMMALIAKAIDKAQVYGERELRELSPEKFIELTQRFKNEVENAKKERTLDYSLVANA